MCCQAGSTFYAHLLKEDLVAASQQVKIPVAPRPLRSRQQPSDGRGS
jgi:hypothetical protein